MGHWAKIHYVILGFFSLFLTACQTFKPHLNRSFSLPEQIFFQSQIFEKVTHNQLDEMQQLLYLPSDSEKNPNQWQRGILLFLDKNSLGKTLEERAALRQKTFAQQAGTQAKVAVVGQTPYQELRTAVLYPPTERFQDVQLEVTRGRMSECGYEQMQLADKQLIKRADFAKNKPKLTAYQNELMTLAELFNQFAWQIRCQ